jgi:hypothetical protein
MGEDESEQPLTEHLVDQFASYFLITMVAFHLVGYMKKQYKKRYSDNLHKGKCCRDDV